MTEILSGLDLLTKAARQLAGTLIQPRDSVIGCIKATGESGENNAFIALDTRLLYLAPQAYEKHYSIEYFDMHTVEVNQKSGLFDHHRSELEIGTAYKNDASTVSILVDQRHHQYAVQFAEALRAKVREARMPSTKVELNRNNPAAFIDELERL